MKLIYCLWLGLLLAAQGAFAAKTEPPIKATDKVAFEKVVAQIRAEMKPEGRYEELTASERKSVDAGLDSMSQLFDKTPDVASMNDDDKRAMFNAQETVNAALLKRDGDRLICVKEARSGTHFKTTKCRTAREIERDRRGSQEWMQNTTMHHANDFKPSGG